MDGFCIYGQAPVMSPPPAVESNPAYDAWLARCGQARAEKMAREAEHAERMDALFRRGAYAVTVPRREQIVASALQAMAVVRQSMHQREIAQTWGRLTSEEFSARAAADRRELAALQAVLDQAEGA